MVADGQQTGGGAASVERMDPDDFPTGYRPCRELGHGSMGTVWLAWHAQTEGHCAVKVLSLRNDRRGSAERSFNREVRAMARLHHPNIIEVHDYGRTPKGSPFVAMEYAPGASLHSYVRGAWTWPQLWTLLDGLVAGLGHAHARDLVHRDLKPGNVMVAPDKVGPGAIKLADFGIALAVTEASRASRRIEGTPAYIAPEAASGDVASTGPWTDLYSLGVMLFEVLTGDLPYHGRHLLAHHQRSPLPPIIVRDDVDVPRGLVDITRKLMAKSPVERFRSVAGLRDALAALGPLPTPVPLGPAPGRSRLDDDPPTGAEPIRPMRGPAGPALFHLRQPALVGREGAKQVLKVAAEAVLTGQGPRVVLIEGDAGLGKSRLAGWLREEMEEAGLMRTMTVRSEPQTRTGGGLRQAVLRYIGAPTLAKHAAPEVFAQAFPDETLRRQALETLWAQPQGEGPGFGELLVKRAGDMLAALIGPRPFLFMSDDAQWSPEGRVLRLVHRLGRDPTLSRLLMVVTLRPSDRTTVQAARRALLKLPGAQLIQLAHLTPRDLAPALEGLAPLPAGIAEAACISAAGNPLLALEAVRAHLEDEGLGSAPADPNAVLAQRIERASQGPGGGELRSALARATLLGRSFTVKPLAQLCAVPGDPDAPALPTEADAVEALLERAGAAGLAIEQGPGRWRFSHDLVRAQFREVCRLLANWPALNLAAAELKKKRAAVDPTGIELEVVARHHWEGGERALGMRQGVESVQRLHAAGLMGHATSFTRRLLEWDDRTQLLSAEDRCELRLLGSDAAEHAGQPFEAERHALAAVELARRNYLPALGARAASRVGVLKIQADDVTTAERWLWDALRFARQSGDAKARSNAHLSLGQLYNYTEKKSLALTAFEASLEGARQAGLDAEALAARAAIARIDRLEGRTERAERTFEQVARAAQEAGLEVMALDARLQLGLCAWVRDDPDDAKVAFDEVRRGARGNLFVLEFQACLGEAWAHAAGGAWTDCEMALMQAEDLRYDVRMHDPEVERLRQDLRALAQDAHRVDVVERADRLDLRTTRTHSTHAE